MRKRLITSLGLAAIGLPAILFGGIFYYLLMGTFLIGAAWEYVNLFRAAKFEPQIHITVGGVALITITRMFFPAVCTACFCGEHPCRIDISSYRLRARTRPVRARFWYYCWRAHLYRLDRFISF